MTEYQYSQNMYLSLSDSEIHLNMNCYVDVQVATTIWLNIAYIRSTSYFYNDLFSEGFPCGSTGKEFTCNEGDLGSIPGLGRSPGEGKGYPLQCSSLENSMDCIVNGVAKSQTRLSDCHSF